MHVNEQWVKDKQMQEKGAISHGSHEDLRKKLKCTYGDKIQETSKLFKLYLNYQTGVKVSRETTSERFSITITRYEILLSSSIGPPTLRWHLVFANVKAIFPFTDFSSKVLYARNLAEFTKICHAYDIERLPGGRTIEDLLWIQKYHTKMISVDAKAKWKNNTTNGLYEGANARVIRINRTANIINIIKKIRSYDDNENVLHFYGWHEESDYYHFAFEMCCVTSEDFSEAHSFTEISRAAPLRLDILTGVAKGVSSLQRKGINHGNLMPNNIFIDNHEIAKLGSCNFIFEGEKDEHKGFPLGSLSTNMHDFAKILLYCTSGGSYQFSDQEVGVNELKLCKIVEARDLIEKILKDSILTVSDLLRHHFFWGTIKRLFFIVDFSEHILNQADNAPIVLAVEKECQKNKLYQTRWDTNMSKSQLLTEIKDYRVKMSL
ncbi:serine/threonine-protein kinase/endoribonuclease IRE1 [Tanacetum coccineum]